MSLDSNAPAEARGVDDSGTLSEVEHGLSVLALALLTLLPIVEIVLRRFDSGVPGGTPFVQHLTLVVALLGGALAARDDRLLALATGSFLLAGPHHDGRQGARGIRGRRRVGSARTQRHRPGALGARSRPQHRRRRARVGVPGAAASGVRLDHLAHRPRVVQVACGGGPGAALGAVVGWYLGAGLPLNWSNPLSAADRAGRPRGAARRRKFLCLVAARAASSAGWPARRSSRCSAAPRPCCSCRGRSRVGRPDPDVSALAPSPRSPRFRSSPSPASCSPRAAPHRLLRVFRALLGWMPGGTAVVWRWCARSSPPSPAARA